ncbi:uncharacterized protein LOC134206152 [Armigeres subalbatus]|uniref:uncharacterized protein LOC134206152 n=1 Tax=Armigeres subalbatus TaxID=124917 RepID=UPI002ED11BEA
MDILRKVEPTKRRYGVLQVSELREAEYVVIRRMQQNVFNGEWKVLSAGGTVARSSPLRWFHPRLSQDRLIRVGGRLEHSSEREGTKHPIVLPAKHPFTKRLLEHYYHKLLHAGPQLLLGAIRLQYWPLGGRSVAREVVHQCIRCFRVKPKTVEQFMGELPAARVTVSRPFSNTGVDYFGPVYVRLTPRRAAVKAYVAIFICMCTKAVHLELVTDLSTERFIQALRRFIGRRGRVTDIYSDNGTNFVGARNQIKQLFVLLKSREHHETVARECTKDEIQWHFNPPSAPHFGGLWEAAVRSAKFHLLRVLGEQVLTFEDMNTLLVQVEACLNSRPLTAMSDDPNDLEPLTPGHFLIGASLHQLPDRDFSSVPINRLSQIQVAQKICRSYGKDGDESTCRNYKAERSVGVQQSQYQ